MHRRSLFLLPSPRLDSDEDESFEASNHRNSAGFSLFLRRHHRSLRLHSVAPHAFRQDSVAMFLRSSRFHRRLSRRHVPQCQRRRVLALQNRRHSRAFLLLDLLRLDADHLLVHLYHDSADAHANGAVSTLYGRHPGLDRPRLWLVGSLVGHRTRNRLGSAQRLHGLRRRRYLLDGLERRRRARAVSGAVGDGADLEFDAGAAFGFDFVAFADARDGSAALSHRQKRLSDRVSDVRQYGRGVDARLAALLLSRVAVFAVFVRRRRRTARLLGSHLHRFLEASQDAGVSTRERFDQRLVDGESAGTGANQ